MKSPPLVNKRFRVKFNIYQLKAIVKQDDNIVPQSLKVYKPESYKE